MHSFQVEGEVVVVDVGEKARLVVVRYGQQRDLDMTKHFQFVNAVTVRVPNNVWDGSGYEFTKGSYVEIVGQLQGAMRKGPAGRVIESELVAAKISPVEYPLHLRDESDATQPAATNGAGNGAQHSMSASS